MNRCGTLLFETGSLTPLFLCGYTVNGSGIFFHYFRCNTLSDFSRDIPFGTDTKLDTRHSLCLKYTNSTLLRRAVSRMAFGNFIRRGKYEKNISAEQNQARQNTRIPDTDVHQSRTENHQTAQSQRQKTPCALIPPISEISLKDA